MDIFVFVGNPCGGGLFMVSERLKQRLEQEKITGITFEEYPYTISIDE
jgi:tRNA uridine 5-carbamoylmethylation protein Kti12